MTTALFALILETLLHDEKPPDATGIDGLIDMVESLQVNYSLNLDNSLDLDALLEDDDWSAPASSLDGIMDDDLEL